MTLTPETKKQMSPRTPRIAGLAVIAMAMVTSAMALPTLNGTISDLIYAVVNILPSLLNLIIAVAPLIIVGALISFVVMFFDKILSMLKFR